MDEILTIKRVENGFIVSLTAQGVDGRNYVAKSFQELQKVVGEIVCDGIEPIGNAGESYEIKLNYNKPE